MEKTNTKTIFIILIMEESAELFRSGSPSLGSSSG